jgi:hypothetical protein
VIGLGIWLGAIGVGDAVAGLSGQPASARRALLGWICATATAVTFGFGFGLGWGTVAILTIASSVSSASWLVARMPGRWTSRRAIATSLTALAAVLASTVAWSSQSIASGGPFGRWLHGSSFGALSRQAPDRVVLVTGSFVALLATANALVRLLLAAVGTEVEQPEERLRGGRIIGPMERILILGFALAGQFAAAALVVSAKSLLRFPEISRSDQRIDALTEYFLVCSMSSWLLALAPVVLLLR